MEVWTYDESIHCGVDYSNEQEAIEYDEQHQKFRDYKKEVETLLSDLNLSNSKDLTLIDLGCGTGSFEVYASKYFKKIYAIDVSEIMLQQAKNKIQQKDITNVECIHSGFINYKHLEAPADIIVTKVAFHHLPDFWKQVALLNMNKMIKMNGILYIFDIVFQFEPNEYKTNINNWINDLSQKANPEFRKEIETHIKDEYSTFDWILRGLLQRAGFEIEKSRTSDGFISEYFCRKVKDFNE